MRLCAGMLTNHLSSKSVYIWFRLYTPAHTATLQAVCFNPYVSACFVLAFGWGERTWCFLCRYSLEVLYFFYQCWTSLHHIWSLKGRERRYVEGIVRYILAYSLARDTRVMVTASICNIPHGDTVHYVATACALCNRIFGLCVMCFGARTS